MYNLNFCDGERASEKKTFYQINFDSVDRNLISMISILAFKFQLF